MCLEEISNQVYAVGLNAGCARRWKARWMEKAVPSCESGASEGQMNGCCEEVGSLGLGHVG